MIKNDLTGRRFSALLVTGRGYHAQSKTTQWVCKCDCGTEKVVRATSLQAGKAKSCGCMQTANRLKDITGEVYGKLTITGFSKMAPNRVSIWFADCECGNKIELRKSHLWVDKNGKKNTVSCGCHKKAAHRERLTTHGEMTGRGKRATKEYACWQNIFQRCENPNNPRYKSYGAKGVTVCKAWHEFDKFLADVGRAPEDKPFIDRIDPYGNYEPSNVRWVDMNTSNANKR